MVNVELVHMISHPLKPEDSPISGIKLQLNIKNRDESGRFGKDYKFLFAHVELRWRNAIIADSSPLMDTKEFMRSEVVLQPEFYLHRHIIQTIESKRADDIEFQVRIEGLISYLHKGENTVQFENFLLTPSLNFSQKKWNALLRDIGYADSWVIEIPRPKIEGFDIVKEHLDKAGEAIASRDYEKAMSDCRVVWESIDPILKSQWEKFERVIDFGSHGEERYDSKSKRINKLKEVIKLWSQIGVHREAYAVKPEDALLCYRTTVVLVSYLGEIRKKMDLKEK